MNLRGVHDTLEVINGPEDGAAFTITRVPCDIGSDPSCTVNLTTDRAVRPVHARITAAGDGYRVRCTDGAAVRVNGRRAGSLRSRIVRTGGILQVGDTFLCLQCVPGGLASRSHGISTDNDLLWAVRLLLGKLLLLCRIGWRSLRRLFNNTLSMFITALVILVLLSYFFPDLRYRLMEWFYYLRARVMSYLQ